jgi:hypothetical protein
MNHFQNIPSGKPKIKSIDKIDNALNKISASKAYKPQIHLPPPTLVAASDDPIAQLESAWHEVGRNKEAFEMALGKLLSAVERLQKEGVEIQEAFEAEDHYSKMVACLIDIKNYIVD